MANGFNVTAETLQADATRIANGASNIEGHLAFLQNAVSSVVNAAWIGAAAQSAAALHEKLDRAGRDVKESTTFFSQSTDHSPNPIHEFLPVIGADERQDGFKSLAPSHLNCLRQFGYLLPNGFVQRVTITLADT